MTAQPLEAAVPLDDPRDEVRRLLAAADAAALPLRAIGGLAVAIRAPSIAVLFPDRAYHDIDLVAPGGRPDIEPLLESLGYLPQRRFNALNGAERLLFHDPGGRRLDVFVERLRMCHELAFADRLHVDALTLPLADLVLSKLQIVNLTTRDRQDLVALLVDHPLALDDASGISIARIGDVCGSSWGWWRTATRTLTELETAEPPLPDDPRVHVALERSRALLDHLRHVRRSLRWRIRALAGERLAWHDDPEEVR